MIFNAVVRLLFLFFVHTLSFSQPVGTPSGIVAAEPLSPKTKIESDCDYPLGEVDSKPAKDSAACSDLCQKNTSCRTFTFISGWNRCLMRSKPNRKNGVVMHGGTYLPAEGSDSKRVFRSYGSGFDHRGKDLKKIPSTPSEVACQEGCEKTPTCVGYVWISGYNDCWLKKTEGAALAKKFFCGQVR